MKRGTRTQIVCPVLLRSLLQYQSFSPAEVLGARYLAKGTNENCMMDHKLKDVRAQNFPRTDFFKTLTAGRK